jgi:hypothetical protein
LTHFPCFFSVDDNPKYILNYPFAAKCAIQRGHGEGLTYRVLLDRLDMADVCWRSYEEYKEIQDFEKIFWYSGWIMCGADKVYRHLHERVKRQYGYVQNVPRRTEIVELQVTQIVQTFIDFHTHMIKEPDWGEPTGETTWQMDDDYMLWYRWVSDPQILPPTIVSPPRNLIFCLTIIIIS